MPLEANGRDILGVEGFQGDDLDQEQDAELCTICQGGTDYGACSPCETVA